MTHKTEVMAGLIIFQITQQAIRLTAIHKAVTVRVVTTDKVAVTVKIVERYKTTINLKVLRLMKNTVG